MAVLGLAFVVLWVGSLDLRPQAALFPRLVATAGLIFVLAVLLSRLRTGDHDEAGPSRPERRRLWLPLAATPVYGVLLFVFGFYAAAGLVVGGLPWLLGYRRPVFLVGLAICTVAALHLGFSVLLNVPIPHGVVGDWVLYNFVYVD